MKVAFYGRVSTDDAQAPRSRSRASWANATRRWRQSARRSRSPSGMWRAAARPWRIAATAKRDWTAEVDVPRVGGLPEMLAAAKRGEVDAVIVESIDRLSRMTADGTRIERELEECDVALFAADEPLNSSATAILTRRGKQGVAEWYVRDLIERSRAGMEESVRQG